MAKSFSYYRGRKDKIIEDNYGKVKAFNAYEDMWHGNWSLPTEMDGLDWVRKSVSSDPHDAIYAGTRVLTALEPDIKVMPLVNNMETKARMNEVERILKATLKGANSRRQGKIEVDLLHNALLYDEITAQVIDLDTQIKAMEAVEANTNRWKAARRYGRFVVNCWNPKFVHVTYSSLMPEEVLLCRKLDGMALKSEFGKLAKFIKDENDESEYELFDYTNYEKRCVWVEGGAGLEKSVIGPEDLPYPFMNWVTTIGGTTTAEKNEDRRHPMLYSIYKTGQWETQNIIETLVVSEVIWRAAAARAKEEGPNQMTSVVDYGDPNQVVKVPVGNTYTPLPPPMIDRALTEILDRTAASVSKSTVSRVLMNADIPSQAAFATLNLATQTALGALKPGKALAEKALAQILTQFMLWVHYSGKPLEEIGKSKEDWGSQYTLLPEHIDPERIFITTELKPDLPTDRAGRVQAASTARQFLGYSQEAALEDIGVEDPAAMIEQSHFERLQENEVLLEIKRQEMDLQMQFETARMGLQQAMQQQQMQQQQEMAAAQGQLQSGIPGAQGQAYNPAAGMPPPQMSSPGATREGVTGMSRGGVPVAEV